MNSSLLRSAQTVIIGGGVMGCSVLYHLARSGMSDVVLLERKSLTSGTTWHAAGLLAQLRSSKTQTELARYSINLYEQLEAETGQQTGVRRNGTLCLAQTSERWIELKRRADQAVVCGLETVLVTKSDIKSMWPLMNVDDLVGGLLIPSDGQGDPTGITLALAKSARRHGAHIKENCLVTKIAQSNSGAWDIETTDGPITCETVVNCSGIWAPELARLNGVSVPLHAVEHMYVVTEPMEGLDRGLPSVRDYDNSIYLKEDAGRLIMGGNEPNAKLWPAAKIPDNFEFTLLPEDWNHFEIFMDPALSRVPALGEIGIRQLLVGPESFTPDGKYLLGEAPNCRGYFVAAGFNSIGIASAGGAGLALGQWIIEGEPTMDLSDVDIRRFPDMAGNTHFLKERIPEIVATGFAIHFPHYQLTSARDIRRSPVHIRLSEQGACFDQAVGWERPEYFAIPGKKHRNSHSFNHPSWFDRVAREHQAVRQAVGILDLTSFSKIQVCGADALALLQKTCSRNIDIPIDRVIYTLMLNVKGLITCDATITRTKYDTFLLVTGAKNHKVLVHYLTHHAEKNGNVSIVDLTSAFAVLGVMGPQSREMLQSLSDVELSNQAFPFLYSKEIDIGFGRCRATRISYAGELGWELYIPTEFALSVYDTIAAIGSRFDLCDVGFQALDSLRLECGFRHFGHDIANTDTPQEAGLEFTVDHLKKSPFLGKEAYLKTRSELPRQRLLTFTTDDPSYLLLGNEPIYQENRLVGSITSSAFGHTIGKSVALGYVKLKDQDDLTSLPHNSFYVGISGEKVSALASSISPYDPSRRRLRS